MTKRYTHTLNAPVTIETYFKTKAIAQKRRISAPELIRELLDKYLVEIKQVEYPTTFG